MTKTCSDCQDVYDVVHLCTKHGAVDELIEALRTAANELDLLYAFAINHGLPEAGNPPHVVARATLNSIEVKHG